MSELISYAQNFEDVMLWRALGFIEGGCYIDIGAQSPEVDSVSRVFYENGWRGVHVEAMSSYAEQLRKARPEEIVIQAAVAATPGTLSFFAIPETGLSTMQRDIALQHREAGFEVHETVVPAITLDAVFACVEREEVHWLKIDVEGAERDVLLGWRESQFRPWVVVIESTVPLSQQESYVGWEDLILEKGYRFAYFDGLNRYYIPIDRDDLAAAFLVPPNLFDDFALSFTSSTPFRREFTKGMQAIAAEREKEKAIASTEIAELLTVSATLREELVRSSEVLLRTSEAKEQMVAELDRSRALTEAQNARIDAFQRQTDWLQREYDAVGMRLNDRAEAAHRWWASAESLRREL
jgi:FkbM family methyltransferase